MVAYLIYDGSHKDFLFVMFLLIKGVILTKFDLVIIKTQNFKNNFIDLW